MSAQRDFRLGNSLSKCDLQIKTNAVVRFVDIGGTDNDFFKRVYLLQPALYIVHGIEGICIP